VNSEALNTICSPFELSSIHVFGINVQEFVCVSGFTLLTITKILESDSIRIQIKATVLLQLFSTDVIKV